MKHYGIRMCVTAAVLASAPPAFAAEPAEDDRFNVSLGAYFVTRTDGTIRLDATAGVVTIGTSIDWERDLGGETSMTVPRIDGYYRFARGKVAAVPALISRTGYTGEDGFELYVPWGETGRVWDALLDAGKPMEVAPIGLGARDTLRLEMRYALYGNDIDATTNPLEAVLGWVVKPAKGDFIGKAAIERVRAEGPRRKLVGLEMSDRSVARH